MTKNQENIKKDESNITGSTVNKNDKIMVKIPIDPLNPLDLIIPVQINGYKWIIKRGETILLPKNVVNILEAGGYFN